MFRKRILAACKAFLYPEIADIRDIATGALTKTEFLNASEKLLKRAQKDKRIFSLAFLDADGLKTINDA